VTKDELNKDYGIKILLPEHEAMVSNPIQLSGTFEIKPPDKLIRILEFEPLNGQYWPKEFVIFDEKRKKWYTEINIGGRVGSKREIIVAAIGSNGKALLEYSRKVGSQVKEWPGLDSLTTDIVVCDRISITRATNTSEDKVT
jgi:hypothetical protein